MSDGGAYLAKPYSAKPYSAVQESDKLYFAKPGNWHTYSIWLNLTLLVRVSTWSTFVPSFHPFNVNWCSEKGPKEGNDGATFDLRCAALLALGSFVNRMNSALAGRRMPATQLGRIKHCLGPSEHGDSLRCKLFATHSCTAVQWWWRRWRRQHLHQSRPEDLENKRNTENTIILNRLRRGGRGRSLMILLISRQEGVMDWMVLYCFNHSKMCLLRFV